MAQFFLCWCGNHTKTQVVPSQEAVQMCIMEVSPWFPGPVASLSMLNGHPCCSRCPVRKGSMWWPAFIGPSQMVALSEAGNIFSWIVEGPSQLLLPQV